MMEKEELEKLLNTLLQFTESTWLEFKCNNAKPDEVGEYISALANSAALAGRDHAYIVWGIDDVSHEVVGTTFEPDKMRVQKEELESWLLRSLESQVEFQFYRFEVLNKWVVILEIAPAFYQPVQFKKEEFIRIGSYKKPLREYPEKERELWRVFEKIPFEDNNAITDVTTDEVIQLLDFNTYFKMVGLGLPNSRNEIVDALQSEQFIKSNFKGGWNITNLGALLFASK